MSHSREFVFLERIKRYKKCPDYLVPRMPKIRVRRAGTSKKSPDSDDVKKTRRERKKEVNEAIAEAQDAMWELAEAMQTRFGGKKKAPFYYHLILQRPHVALDRRSINKWNAFVHGELKRRNNELEPGTELYRVNDLSNELRVEWNAMTSREKTEATKEYVKEIQAMRDTKTYASQNTQLGAFHDARRHIAAVIMELQNVNARTGLHSVLITVRGEPDQWSKPHVFYTTEAIAEFFSMFTKSTLSQIATRLEAFLISGVAGVVSNHKERCLQAKSQLAKLVLEKLNAVSKKRIPQMNYVNFDEVITRPYGIVLRGYPPGVKFCSPSNLGSLHEVELVTASWQSGTTHWYKMKKSEHKKWKKAHRNPAESHNGACDAEDDAAGESSDDEPLIRTVAQPAAGPADPTQAAGTTPTTLASTSTLGTATVSPCPPTATASPCPPTTASPSTDLPTTSDVIPPTPSSACPPTASITQPPTQSSAGLPTASIVPPPLPPSPEDVSLAVPSANASAGVQVDRQANPHAELDVEHVLVQSTIDNQPPHSPPTSTSPLQVVGDKRPAGTPDSAAGPSKAPKRAKKAFSGFVLSPTDEHGNPVPVVKKPRARKGSGKGGKAGK
ncbi:uncharacterized protein C8Q71DRAFT_863192 [Rhodofomes roseus]|uniref:HMG box domain-containing protein n=1 Tax=Rhodofomes roseus TaxID=34475 RepID=A0ABQ8JYS4_9APHY|nr:uncharacterized protein C8Q71DRAFT_863192 [Rhodofomes roseus]KAH9829420.1 hypothetical protein C8Q71DRAFT_863192 [Rhodofomes roseus]